MEYKGHFLKYQVNAFSAGDLRKESVPDQFQNSSSYSVMDVGFMKPQMPSKPLTL